MSKSAKKRKRQQHKRQQLVAQRRATVTPITDARRFEGGMVDRLTASWTTSPTNINNEIYHNLRTMRARSRDLERNNEYGKHFFRTLTTNVIGPSGIEFQSRGLKRNGELDAKDNDRVEQRMRRWSKVGSCDVTRRLSRSMLEAMYTLQLARDGEVIVRKHFGFPNAHAYALEFIDPELLDLDRNEAEDDLGNRVVMGVHVDRFWAPIGYYFLTKYPHPFGDIARNPEYRYVPAEEIVHAFIPMYPNQVRGIPWVHAGMRALRDLGGYREAAIVASRVGAAKMGFWVSPDGQSGPIDGVDSTGDAYTSAQAGEFRQIGADVSLQAWDPTYPHEQFGEFNKAMLRGLSGAFGMAYFTMNNDLESVNLSSARIGLQNERDTYKTVQNFVIETLCDGYFPEWLLLQLPAMNIPTTQVEKFIEPSWQARTWPSPNPLDDAKTAELHIKLKTTSPQRVIRAAGHDPDEILNEIEQWNTRLQEMGLMQVAAEESEDEDESEDESDDDPD